MKTKQKWKICDCIEGLPEIPDKSIDLILTDLPYGVTTRNEWDFEIDINSIWIEYKRIIKENGVVALTSIQPFTTKLIMSNLKMFKYCWYWNKICPTGFLNAKKQPLRVIEDILIFYKNPPIYNPMLEHTGIVRKKGGGKIATNNYGEFKNGYFSEDDILYPKNLINISNANKGIIIHPTQKPLALFEYIIKTYTNEGDTVHDSCLGSGTTLEACMNLNRNCIGFEIDPQWESIYRNRLKLDDTKIDVYNMNMCPK